MRLTALIALVIALPAAADTPARAGAYGLTVNVPFGWRVVSASEAPTPMPLMRVVVLTGSGGSSIQIGRLPIPPELRDQSPVTIARRASLLKEDQQVSETIIAGARTVDTMTTASVTVDGQVHSGRIRLLMIKHDLDLFVIVFSNPDDPRAAAVFEQVLRSIELAKQPERVEAGGVSMALPSGWRELTAEEIKLTQPPELATDPPLLTIKRDLAWHRIVASIKVTKGSLPKELLGSSTNELVRLMARSTARGYRGRSEDAQEKKVAGMPGGEWRIWYKLTERPGMTTEMLAHCYGVSRGPQFYIFSFVGPADDRADDETFIEVMKSVTISAR